MKAQLEQIRRAAKEALATFDSAEQLEKARIQYLGKKGELTAILKQMGKLSAEERPVIGQLANEIRKDIEDTIANKSAEIKKAAQEKRLAEETLDVTMPGTLPQIGYKHPLSIVLDEIKDIFMGMGFDIAEGPEVEYDYYNFEALNIPKDHPARDTQDTFYINDNIVLRTQTSPVQIRVMEKTQHSNHCPGPCIPLRRGRCHPLSPVPPDRGLSGGQGHYHGRPERHAGDLCQTAVRREYKNPPASPPLPLYGAQLRN